jgi:hypothetical protein
MADKEVMAGGQDDAYVKKQRKKKGAGEDPGGLTINSLMDIMTILLVFLLISITSDPLSIQQNNDLVLAKSTANTTPKDSIPMTVNKRHIIVDKTAVVKVDCKIGGQLCTENDFTLKAACQEKNANCSEDELEKADAMYFYVAKDFKEDGSDEKFLINPLHKELERLVKLQKDENASLDRKFEGVTTVICDKDIPFRLIAEVVYSAGMAELHDIRFAIIKSSRR